MQLAESKRRYRYLDDVCPSFGGVVGGVEGVESAGEDVGAVEGAEHGVDLLHPPALVQVVQVRAVEVHLPGLGHLDRRSKHVPAYISVLQYPDNSV